MKLKSNCRVCKSKKLKKVKDGGYKGEIHFVLSFNEEKTLSGYIPSVIIKEVGEEEFTCSWTSKRFPIKGLARKYAKIQGLILMRKLGKSNE